MIIYVRINSRLGKPIQSSITTKIPSKSTRYKKVRALVQTFPLLYTHLSSSHHLRRTFVQSFISIYPIQQHFRNSSSSCSSHFVLYNLRKFVSNVLIVDQYFGSTIKSILIYLHLLSLSILIYIQYKEV